MKNIVMVTFLALTVALNWNCVSTVVDSSGTNIIGSLTNSENLTVYFDQLNLTSAIQVMGNASIDGDGNFKLNLPNGVDAGVYRFRIGQKKFNLVFDGKEKNINLKGDLQTVNRYQFEVEGSKDAQSFVEVMQKLINRQMNAKGVTHFVNNTENPILAMFIAHQALGQHKQFIRLHQQISQKLAVSMPESQYVKDYALFIQQAQAAAAAPAPSGPIAVGQPAPDIDLPSPIGKNYKLSDLKGKIVLLDFWASWCVPCRRENPRVVEVYKKYKDQGFTIYSVSLDGVDGRTAARYGGDTERVSQAKDQQKQRWVGAIEKDNLLWDTHVSDLKKWDCAPAKAYGVRGIPKTFLIDKEGNIAQIGLRGAASIESAVKKLL